ncbi:helix-turn-helix transcriptional regulator [Nocardia sp. NBC_01503]|uniref:helix-turn-helix transcriptional regulator n=1 Tax=Nocardia sp. NBC_01503 TaxID=2975997 RepID=UPI002E7B0D30|nr:helix-turn-helix transcriptional regulator [Nocardia sp. NBC_01503]WTL34071.1 helix-turn-helix transcriptional regulator [Nocardia sp. NBC_01503]
MDSDLGEFLRSRRARIQPAEAGLREYGRRRVPGLRREEVAQLAGVSVDYYIRLEQGRGRNASDAVLDAVARALRLTDSERQHLYALARPSGTHPSGGTGVYQDTLRPGARLVLDAIAAPAFVLGRRMDVIAWNALGDKVSGFSSVPAAERNQARYLFLNPLAPEFYPDWEAVAVETVAFLRRDAGLHPDDPALHALVDELTERSVEFRRIWTAHPVKEKTHGAKRIRHTAAGLLEMGYESLLLPGDPDQLLVVYTAVPGSATAAALAALAESATTAHV